MGGVLDVREPIRTHDLPPQVASNGPVASLPLGAASLPEKLLAWFDARRRILFAGLAFLFLLSFNGQWRMEPDGALYLTVARNVAEGHGYTYHGEVHRLAYPGLPWMFAGLFKVFGTQTVLPALIVMPLLGLASLALCYRLFLLHAGRSTAVLITVALGLARTFYRYNFELLSEIPFLMGVLAFLVGWESVVHRRGDAPQTPDDPTRGRHHWGDWLLLFGGLLIAIVTRPTMWSLLLASGAALMIWTIERPLRSRRIAVWVVALSVAGVGASLYLHSKAGKAGYEYDLINSVTEHSGDVLHQVLTDTGPSLLQPTASEALFGLDMGTIDFKRIHLGTLDLPVAVIPSAIVLACGLALFRRRPLWGCFVCTTILMMLVRVVHVRYLLQVLPLLIYGFWLAAVEVHRRLPARWAGPVFVGAMALLFGFNATRVVGFVYEQRHVPFLDYYREGVCVTFTRVAEQLKTQTPSGSWVLSPEKTGRILTSLSERNVAEPSATIDFRPQWQNLYVLEPMDADGRRWMMEKQIGVGDAIGEPVLEKRRRKEDVVWQLHRAVLVVPGTTPTTAPALPRSPADPERGAASP